MRTYQVTHREGELLGDIDWNFDFFHCFDCYCCNDERRAEIMSGHIERLWQVERLHKKGIPLRIREGEYWHDLIAVGMYDGWPYWKPFPAILIAGPIGSEWRHFPCVDEYQQRR